MIITLKCKTSFLLVN